MNCQKCGNKIENNYNFCSKCGNQINNFTNYNVQNNAVNKKISTSGIIAYIIAGIIFIDHIIILMSVFGLIYNYSGVNFLTSLIVLIPLSIPILYITGLILAIVNKSKNKKSTSSTALIVLYAIMGFILVIEVIMFFMIFMKILINLSTAKTWG